jgi:hypothetical protein
VSPGSIPGLIPPRPMALVRPQINTLTPSDRLAMHVQMGSHTLNTRLIPNLIRRANTG